MKIFYDWEFEENGTIIIPISLGMVSEEGKYIYVMNSNYFQPTASDWLKENVLNNMASEVPEGLTVLPWDIAQNKIGSRILEYIDYVGTDDIELVAYYADYDHVCLAQRFGAMINMPDVIPWITYDLKQWADDLGVKLPKQTTKPHNALNDAFYVRDCYNWLVENYKHPAWESLEYKRLCNRNAKRSPYAIREGQRREYLQTKHSASDC